MSSRSRLLPDRDDAAAWRRLAAVVVASVLVVAALVLAWQAARSAILLDRAGRQAALLQQQVAVGDVTSARGTMDQLQDSVARAHGSTDGPLWVAAGFVPLLGDDVDAVRTVARELDRVARRALPPVVGIAERVQLDAFSPQDGRIDLANLREAGPAVDVARAELDRADEAFQGIEPEKLVGRVRIPMERLRASVGSAALAARAADAAADLLPDMLGGEEERRYLLLIQNNAEVRSLGGIPGSFAVLEAKGGKVTMGEQGSARDIPPRKEALVEVPRSERGVLPPSTATDLRDTTISPDFPAAARYAMSLGEASLDEDLDGVVSVDPVTLAYLLEGLGPVTLRDGTRLTAQNAVEELLNGVYRRYADDFLGQDDVFEDAARRIFDVFVEGDGSTQPVLEALVRAASDNRIMVWAEDGAEQRRIATTGVAGELGSSRSTPHVGVYLSDAAGGKMQYYLDASSTLRSVRCVDDSSQRLELRTRLTNEAGDDARSLPASITGTGGTVRPGDQRLNVRVVAPAGAMFESLDIDGEEQTVAGGLLGRRQVAVVSVTLRPGQTVGIAATFQTPTGQSADPVLTTTPGIIPLVNDARVRSACR